MGTRGAYGFLKDGKHKVTYNHYDSYPSYLGTEIMKYLQKVWIECDNDENKMNKRLSKVMRSTKMVNQNKAPTKKDFNKMAEMWAQLSKEDRDLFDLGEERTKSEYYALLRPLQGNLELLEQFTMMNEGASFLGDSLFCEWAYIINLNTNELEIYTGFNHNKDARGRYATLYAPYNSGSGDVYYGVALAETIPFETIGEMEDVKDFCQQLEKLLS